VRSYNYHTPNEDNIPIHKRQHGFKKRKWALKKWSFITGDTRSIHEGDFETEITARAAAEISFIV
jgi:hypothetical protein